MANSKGESEKKAPGAPGPVSEKEARRAAALRANLKRRKAAGEPQGD